jgi:NAD(P)-dependent dehydrogenase (short-subunit alcohol dehydrogenase family)
MGADDRIWDGVAVVAGGSAGIGRATARRLAAEGFDVAVLARDQGRLQDTEAELEGYGVAARAYVCDVADDAAVEQAAERIEAELGPISVWVNNAMLTVFGPFGKVRPGDFERVIDVTFLGQVNGTRAALKRMRPRGYGRIVNVGSGLAFRSVPLQSAYCAAKHAIAGFSASVRSELIHDGSQVTVSMIQLPTFNTPQFDWARSEMGWVPSPAPPIYDPKVAAKAILRAVESGERELLVGNFVVMLGAGQMASPDYMDRKMATGGYEVQMSDDPETGARPDNLYDPVPKPVGARGRHGRNAKQSGLIVNGDTARIAGLLSLVAGGALLGAVAAGAVRR